MNIEFVSQSIPGAAILNNGGPVILILLLLSIIALTIILVKCVQFFPPGLTRQKHHDALIEQWLTKNKNEALQSLKNNKDPIDRVMYSAMQGVQRGWSESHIREEAERVASIALEELARHLKVLEIIASLSPLLGLLGTVMGMIEAFQAMESAGHQVNPAILSGGIWQALLTTAAGLAVAIPVAAMLGLFESLLHRKRHQMENALTQIILSPAPESDAQ